MCTEPSIFFAIRVTLLYCSRCYEAILNYLSRKSKNSHFTTDCIRLNSHALSRYHYRNMMRIISDSLKKKSLTHWGRKRMAAISQRTFSNAFSWMKIYEFQSKFHWSLFSRVQLTIFQHWFRQWLGTDQATTHYLNQWWLDYRRMYASLGLNELR